MTAKEVQPERVSQVLIVNSHSQANAGDQAIVRAQLQLLKAHFPHARLVITSRTPGSDRPLLAALGTKVIAPLFHSPAGAATAWSAWGRTLLSFLFPLPALVFLRSLMGSGLVCACGGGYFYSNRRLPGFTFWQNYLPLRLAVLFRKKTVFFPQSFGPLDNRCSRRLLAGLLASRHVQAVFARERISLSIVNGILEGSGSTNRARFCPDMAFYCRPEAEPLPAATDPARLPRPRVALALRDWGFPGQKTRAGRRRKREEYIESVLDACQRLHREHGASFYLFSQAQGPSRAEDDRRMCRRIHSRLQAFVPPSHLEVFPTPVGASPAELIDRLRQVDLLVASRMHAAIFAFLAGIPAVLIGYQHKGEGVLGELGLASWLLPIEAVQADALLAACRDILLDLDASRKRVALAVRGSREAIEANFREVFPGERARSGENLSSPPR